MGVAQIIFKTNSQQKYFSRYDGSYMVFYDSEIIAFCEIWIQDIFLRKTWRNINYRVVSPYLSFTLVITG